MPIHFKSMLKFDKILIQTVLCYSLGAYLNVIICDHFHFMYFGYQCEILSKLYQIYNNKFCFYVLENYEECFLE